MMKISTKGRYALRLMLDLAAQEAAQEGGYVSLREVSLRQGVSVKYLEQIVAQLCRTGYIKSMRGAQGGYRLTRKLEDYKVGDILRATEGDLSPTSCLKDKYNRCPNADDCPTLPFWQGLNRAINDYVDNTTLADVALGYTKTGAAKKCQPQY